VEVDMRKLTFLVSVAVVVVGSGIVFTHDGGSRSFRLSLRGLDEVPVISTTGRGTFRATINRDETAFSWRLTYADLEGTVTQAHIHFAAPNNTGPISLFLCSNLGNGPAGTQACPVPAATGGEAVEGVAMSEDVLGPVLQGIEPGAIGELIAAIKDGKAYVNVHSTKWGGGEIRQQFPADRGDDHGDHR
jgi:CHRD domain-containing protein